MSEQSSLVVYGSTGRRLLFSKQDLKMPETVHQLPHHAFYEKQWATVAGHWFNRVLKEERLQHLSVEQLIEHIQADIAKRWQARKAEQALHKKRKRLLVPDGPAGTPSPRVLLTNVCALAVIKDSADEADKRALLEAVVQRVETCAKEKAQAIELLVDAEAEAPSPAPPAKKAKGESASSPSVSASDGDGEAARSFDDRVAVVCTLSSPEKAAAVIAQLHGSKFDGRIVLCRFFG